MNLNKIMIIDDEPSILVLLEQVFLKAGYDVVTAQSAEEAREILKEGTVHVIVLDLNLPGMSGPRFCRIIKKEMPATIVFAMTGYASLFELSDCKDAGFEDYFTKPIKVSDLLKSTRSAFDRIKRWKKG